MRSVLMLPTPSHARNDLTNSINQIVLRLERALPEFGYTLTENAQDADLIAGHAGQQHNRMQPDVAHVHGLYPSAYPTLIDPWMNAANQSVVNSFVTARAVTAPSEWVADLLRRDCHIAPTVIPWAIDFDEWTPGENMGYVLWNKTRADPVCDPTPIVEMARRVPQIRFLSTFGNNPTPNLRITGRQPFDKMKPMIRNAAVGLCTTKETFCIGALEMMACGMPILGYRHGNVPSLVKHGVNGYVVSPGDIDGLIEGLDYCLKYRNQLGENARAVASLFTWSGVARAIAEVYDGLFSDDQLPRPHQIDPGLYEVKSEEIGEPVPIVSCIIPNFNYARFVEAAINSVKSQSLTNFECIIVDDCSKDNSIEVISRAIADDSRFRLIALERNGGVANARNTGINSSKAPFWVALDADDMLAPKFLETVVSALEADRGLGIAYTALQSMDESGNLGKVSEWPPEFSWEKQSNRQNCVPTCCGVRRIAWRRAGGYLPQYQPAEDANLFLRIVSLGFRAARITTEPLFLYRLHGGSLSESVRTGKQSEPNWCDRSWNEDKQFPLAANGIARPVRNYDRPKVSVVIPVAGYHVPYLAQALDSVERQTERYWECIVVNDTGEPLPGLAPFPWAKVVSTDGNKGAGAARNLGVKHAAAPFVTFLDADDILLPTFLEKTLKKYQQTGRYIYTDWLSINKDGKMEPHTTPEFVTGDVFMKPVQHAVNILIKKALFEQSGGFDETMVSWEDVDWFMRLARTGICGARVAEPLFIYRYLTGQRREKGETIKSEIIGAFNQKYGEYISGAKMCGCNNNGVTKQTVVQGVNGQPPKPDQLVRVVYNAPPGQTQVSGIATKTSYGYRAGGDTFYIKLADLNVDSRFTPIAEIESEKTKTEIPPPPPVITREPVVAL